MKKTLLIGSTCVDVIMEVQRMPATGEDMLISKQELRCGGCSYNVSDILRHFEIPYQLCSPVGSGLYGSFIESALQEKGIPVFARIPEVANGCCYCVVDESGERTFLCEHGAEYIFRREFFNEIDLANVDSIYVSGLELEEPTAAAEIDYVEELANYFKEKNESFTFYFAPGPRIDKIDSKIMDHIMELNPLLHMNKRESQLYTGKSFIMDAADYLNRQTENSVVITNGDSGCYFLDAQNNKSGLCPAVAVKVRDTIGAGDSHFGSVISCLKKGMTLEEAVKMANKISSAVVGVKGSTLTDQEFNAVITG